MMRFYVTIFLITLTLNCYSQQVGDVVTDSLINEGIKLKKDNQYNNALKCFLQASKITSPESSLFKRLHTELGQFYFDWGLFEKAIESTLRASSYHEHTDENLKSIKLLAMSYEKSKKYDMAIVYYKELIKRYSEKSQLKVKGQLLLAIANIYKKTGQYDNATSYELENLKIRKDLKDTVGIFVALNNLGASYKYLKEYPKSLEYLTHSLSLSKLVGNEQQMAITMMNIGFIHQILSHQNTAIQSLKTALEIFQKHNKLYEIGQISNALGAIYFAMEDFKLAKQYALKALQTSQKSKILETQSESYKLLSRIYKEKYMADESYHYLQKYSEIKDSILFKQLAKEQELNQKYYELEVKEAEIKDLIIDKELKDLQVKKLHLENETQLKEWEILKRDKELQAITSREQQLRKEKDFHLLKLQEQKYKIEANQKQFSLIHQKKEIDELQKQNKLTELNDKAKIHVLQLEKQKVEIEKQSLFRNILIVIIMAIPVIGFLIFRIYAYRQRDINSKLRNKTLELEQKMLRAQMNPHFIFNAMNSIQSFVATNDSYSAEKYLARFSKIMRYILENSSKSFVCIDDELTVLKLYVELEQLRFDNKFQYKFIISHNLDLEYVFIPPMLIQPYIENAIVHGLCNKKENDGILTISFEIENEILVCTIIDNGVGRKHSEELKKNKIELYKSMGMQVTKERLDMLMIANKKDYWSDIIDLYDENDNPIGTKVIIRITFKDSDE